MSRHAAPPAGVMHPKRRDTNAKCPRHPRKDYQPLIDRAWAAGWWCELRESNYISCYSPDLSTIIVVPSTPSSGRTLDNLKARFRRAGVTTV